MADTAVDGRTLTVEIDGESHEVELPDGYLTPDDIREHYIPKEMFKKELSKQTRKARQGLADPDELLEDSDFLSRVAEERRDDLIDLLGVDTSTEPDEAVVEKLTRRIEEQKVKPLEQEREELRQTVESLRGRERDADIERTMSELGVDDEHRELVALWGERRMAFDEEHGWVVVDDDGDLDWVQGENGKPEPKRFRHLLADIKDSGERPSWFRGETRSGIGYRGGGDTKSAPGKKKRSEMTRSEKLAYIKDNGDEAFLELPE